MLNIDELRILRPSNQIKREYPDIQYKLFKHLTELLKEKFNLEFATMVTPVNGRRVIFRTDNQPLTSEQKLFIDTFLKGFQSAVDILGDTLFQPTE